MKNMFIVGLLLFSPLVSFALNQQDIRSQDFFVAPAKSQIFRNTLQKKSNSTHLQVDCRKHIEQVMCLVDPPNGNEDKPRECIQEDLSTSVTSLQKIYDVLPSQLAGFFCKLDVIYVERNFIGTAYAGTSSTGEPSQTVMGIRESALKGGFSLAKWISWKEQLSFGGDPNGYNSRDDLVKIDASISFQNNANDFLYFVIAHEFGHIMDFQHQVNSYICPTDPLSNDPCIPQAGSWGALSWSYELPNYEPTPADPWGLNEWIPNAQGKFDHRDELCFYACEKSHGDPSKMAPLYSSLHSSNMLTTYSATNSYDDFAEATAFWALAQYQGKYIVQLPSGERYDLVDKYLHNENYRNKREWLEAFYARLPSSQTLF